MMVLAWPGQTHDGGVVYRRFAACTYCGHKHRISGEGGIKPSLTPEQIDRVVELYDDGYGMRVTKIAALMFVHPSTIRLCLRQRRGKSLPHPGVEPFKRISSEQYQTMRFLRVNLGWYLKDIGAYMGMSPSSVQYYCRRLGFARPDRKRIDARKRADTKRRIAAKKASEVADGGEPLTPAMAGNDRGLDSPVQV